MFVCLQASMYSCDTSAFAFDIYFRSAVSLSRLNFISNIESISSDRGCNPSRSQMP